MIKPLRRMGHGIVPPSCQQTAGRSGFARRRLGLPGVARSTHGLRASILLGLLLTAGCASWPKLKLQAWVADYDTAEARVRASNRDLLIFYKDTRPGMEDQTSKALHSPTVKPSLEAYVCCTLFRSYEPDRRYVAQYGVERAPALILVHRDGTYHARTGPMSTAQIARFLADSTPPGEVPVINSNIPRRVEYDWHRSLESARAKAEQTPGPILVVMYRRLTRDWARVNRLLACREVHTRFAGMVHCRIGTLNPWSKASHAPLGTIKLPALVIIERGGTRRILEMPTSRDAVVRFADNARETKS